MATIQVTPTSRISYDAKTEAIRSWFDDSVAPQTDKAFTPRALARAVLQDNASLFKWAASLPDLVDGRTIQGLNSYSVRFTQEFKKVPVDASEIVVNIFNDSRVYSVYNNYHYDIPPELDPKKIKLDSKRVRVIVEKLASPYEKREISEPQLIVYQYRRIENHPKHPSQDSRRLAFLAAAGAAAAVGAPSIPEGTYFLAWDSRISTPDSSAYWRVLIDAMTGKVIQVIDLLQYETGTGQVFDPNPIVTSGDTGLSSATSIATLDGQCVPVDLERLDPPVMGNLRLHGPFVQVENIESPNVPEPLSPTGDFSFSYADALFLSTMAYFHVDRFQHYIQTKLDLDNVANFSIHVDPQAFNGGDNSFYNPGTKKITLGGGIVPPPANNPVPDAGDAMVILHEYGHAIQDNVNPGFDNPPEGTGEGFGDFLAAVFYDDKHKDPAKTRGIMMSWDANPTDGSWAGRRYDVDWVYGDADYNPQAGGHHHAQFWCAATFELYRKLGGDSTRSKRRSAARDLAIRLHLMANFNVPALSSTSSEMAQQIQAADNNLGGWHYADGLHKKVIYDTFRRRNLPNFPALATDVYIDDGRNGGYGSLSGNDLFTEKLFLDNYWSTKDLWVKVAPYANDADQQAGGPGDHVEPPVNSTAYLYVRVKNKGTSGSGPVTVKAYHSDPTIGLVWPIDWTPTDTPSDTVADIPVNGQHVFGPFPWTPVHVGHECVFAIAECDNDHAVTQDLAPMAVAYDGQLVPFDNNIGQRNLYPTAPKGKKVRGFWVSNPTFERAVVKLDFDSTFPPGWTIRTNLANPEAIHLAARERRWVEVTIDQAQGAEITDFTNPPGLTVTGSIDGIVIGGVSFYAAPPSAFPAPPHVDSPCEAIKPCDRLCLNIPWKDCEVEGELEMKLRFRCGKDKQ